MSRRKTDESCADRQGRLEVLSTGARAPASGHGLVGRKLQSLFAPPEALPDPFLILLEQLDQMGSRQEPDPA